MKRRAFLGNAAKAALAVPFLRAASARGQTTAPRRIVFFFAPDGVYHPHWRPEGSGQNFGFLPGSYLEPLEAEKDRVIVVDGCHLTSSGGHEHGCHLLLTGDGGPGDVGGGMSVDRFIGEEIRAGTRFNQLSFGIATTFQANNDTNILYSGPGTPQPPEDNPEEMYNNIFGGAEPEPGTEAATDWRRARLALTRSDISILRDRIGRDLTDRLDVHSSALDALQQQFTPVGPTNPAVTCAPFSLQNYDYPGSYYPLTHHVNENFPRVARNQRDLLVAALACDTTRVASLQYSHSVSPTIFNWLSDGNNPLDEGYHSLSHTGEGNFDDKIRRYAIARRWITQEFVTFLNQLRDTPDPLGDGSLLDSTLVFWSSELGGSQRHDNDNMPFLLAGAGIQGGQYMQLNDVRHNRLLVTLCQYMGVNVETYGSTIGGSGAIEGVLS